MNTTPSSIELIDRWIKDKKQLTVFLINGVKLVGVITSVDGDTVVLTRGEHSQVIMRHAISTFSPVTSGADIVLKAAV